VEVARLLIEAGADIDKARIMGPPPCIIASQNGHVEVARLLIEAGADIDKAKDDGATPLFSLTGGPCGGGEGSSQRRGGCHPGHERRQDPLNDRKGDELP
jgi:hypothetical protein